MAEIKTFYPQKKIRIAGFEIGNDLPLSLLCGPCQIESRQHAVDICGAMREITSKLGMNYVFKASFDKANRTSINGARGVGIEEGMRTFDEIKKLYDNIPIVTDVHETWQCAEVAEHVDMLQIPAFLCRQTDLVVAAARTGKVVNVKKGQFLAPWDVRNIVKKVTDSGNENVCITERGTSFGYNTLVVDMRAFPQMSRDTGCPVIFDATHSVQQPGGQGASTGGQREFAPVLARAAVAVGVAAVFMETHENPDKALSDGPNTIALKDMPAVLEELRAYDELSKRFRKIEREMTQAV
ncbi:MAG: 3-deoxy-8-phosphooctulonate synthase [Alphaproteobacteria bacterium]|nr:3-deoxy-8-phosphooctulonate synthase [Alphaproteobacteria bacterium]